jgi:secreted PhoX family phosphatase
MAAALAATTAARADFDTFTPLPSSVAAGSLPEAAPLLLANPAWSQRTVADRTTQLGLGQANTGSWDMIASNQTGPSAGRYLLMPFETGSAGVQRVDLILDRTTTIVAPGTQGFVSGDASRWTPWGGYLTAEESWGAGSTKGRLFEVTNPVTTTDSSTTNFVHRSILPRVSHEGLAFDKNNSLYFVDELNGGSIYRYTSTTPNAANGDTYFAAGQSSVLRVGTGSVFGATGSATWVPLTTATGTPLPGAVTIAGGGIDGRATTDLAAFKGTDFNRPEDLEIQTVADGSQFLYFPTTDTHQVFSVHLKNDGTTEVNVFVDRNTINLATGLPVGTPFTNPDNMAIDAKGNIYIVEDQPGGVADIWMAIDADRNGIAEGVARWASMSTVGAEPTGLYFDPLNPDIAYVNIQHPDSGVDRTIQIYAGANGAGASVPEPASVAVLGAFAGAMLLRRRRA